ncbi:MAG: BMP family ABC transporter substrate-binding protein [Lachnospiraceae bacterium]|nr:BMP family ABC transporter substrate-binding protein [Lachnospiraceae bacterium]
MKKKLLAVLLCVAMTASLAACGSSSSSDSSSDTTTEETSDDTEEAEAAEETESDDAATSSAASDITIGVIYVGDENEGYSASHINGVAAAAEALGISSDQIIEKTNIPEDESCYDAAVDLAEQGCDIIFATSFGHEDYLFQAASEYPDIEFCHATGYQAASYGLDNVHNYFDNIYEARYVSGIVAGMKIQEMIDNGEITEDEAKIGYVGAYPYAEVISGFTAFYLGAKSVVDSVTMEVKYTNSWADISLENETAQALIADGCIMIGQHADTTGAPSACEDAGVYCVGYNIDMTSVAPSVALTSSTNNWEVYYEYAISCVLNGESIVTDWAEGYSSGAVLITDLNEDIVTEGTQEAVDEAEAAIADGSLHVFDISTFTVDGETLEEDGEYIYDGYYHESELASAPSFEYIIDGITEK